MVLLPSRSKLLPVLKGRLLLSARIIPLAPIGGILGAPPNTYDTQSLLYRVTGTSEADLTSGPRTRSFSNIGKSSEMLNLYLAFKMGFSAVVPRTGLVRTVVRYFDSIAFTHSLIPIRGYRSRCVVVTDYRLRTTQRWLIFLYRISFLRCIIKSA